MPAPRVMALGNARGVAAARVPAGPDAHVRLQVWWAADDVPAGRLRVLHALLSADERDRAARLSPAAGRRFVVARGLLRLLLARYLDDEPGGLRFGYGARGKPALAAPARGAALGFSVSRAPGLLAYAVARGRAVGIDVERVRPLPAYERLAARFFAPAERAALGALPEPQRREAFFRCWTRKEAYVKARGDGLSLALDSFEVSLAPGEPARLRRGAGGPSDGARWSLADLDLRPGYAAAVAADGGAYRVTCRPWTEPGAYAG
jgi:4'-phosphopantetheinyl transferase